MRNLTADEREILDEATTLVIEHLGQRGITVEDSKARGVAWVAWDGEMTGEEIGRKAIVHCERLMAKNAF